MPNFENIEGTGEISIDFDSLTVIAEKHGCKICISSVYDDEGNQSDNIKLEVIERFDNAFIPLDLLKQAIEVFETEIAGQY